MVTEWEPDILECEVKWDLGSISRNKASGGDGNPAELLKILKDDAVKVLQSICQQIWKTQQWPQEWKRPIFIPIPKRQYQIMFKLCKTALISHASKVMLKILQARLQQYMNPELPDVCTGFQRGRGTKIKLPTFVESWRKQRSFRKMLTSASLTTKKPLTVRITTNWKNLKEMGIPDHLTCFLRNLCAGQEATVRTIHGTADCFEVGKGVL